MDSSTSTTFAKQPTSNGNGRITWPEAYSMTQTFSLPSSIIYYMAKNPSSPEAYSKLAQCCKYFFEKKPLLVVTRIPRDIFCLSNDCKECIKRDLGKLTSKIWLTHQYKFHNVPSFNALLSQKLYKCENAELKCYWQTIAFENFKLIASSFEKFHFQWAEMVDKDKNDVQLEEILGSLPNVKEFKYYGRPDVTAATMKKISQLKNLCNLRLFHLDYVSELFDVKELKSFIMKNKDTKFWLEFEDDISHEYMTQLNGLCDTVINSEDCKCVIEYDGQDEKKLAVMCERYGKANFFSNMLLSTMIKLYRIELYS